MQKHQGTNPAQFLSSVDRTILTTEREIEKMQKFVAGLRLARESVAGMVLQEAARPSANGSRVAALRSVLETARKPLTTDEMLKELGLRGYATTKASLAATLSYGKRKGFAKNVGRGEWQAVTALAA